MFLDFVPAIHAASTDPIIDPSVAYAPGDIVTIGVSLIVLIAWLFAVLFIIWWGVMLILSGGKDEKVKPAINSIRYAVLWVVIIVISIFVAPKVGDLLGLNVSQYLSAKTIFSTIKVLANRIFGAPDSSNSLIDSTDSIGDDFTNLEL